jgi:4-hydroxymandelate oxidase
MTEPSSWPISLDDYAAHAATLMDDNAAAYVDGGAGDEQTVLDNRRAWATRRLVPRVLRDLSHGHTGIELLGRPVDHPVMLAPVAYQRLVHPDGEAATALAAAAQGAGFVLSAQSSVSLEQVAQLVVDMPERGPLWFQLHALADRGYMRELVRRAESAGFDALVLTADAPVQGVRDRERRARFSLPAGVRAVNLQGMARAPSSEVRSNALAQLLGHATTWRDVEWLAGQSRLPLIVKGLLGPADARQAVTLGARAVVVSNHGGRTLDGAVATADALPDIVDAVGGAVPVLVDGGLRRGVDVLRAVALGARAVLVGRPQVHALAVGGAQGVAHMIRLMRDELEMAMALSGCATLSEAGPWLLHGGARQAKT